MRITHLAAALAALAAITTLPALAAHPFQGKWVGQAEFRADAGYEQLAHNVTSLSLTIGEHGKIEGAASEIGCKVLGLLQPGSFATSFKAEMTLSGCQNPAQNGRLWNGFMSLQNNGTALFRINGSSRFEGKSTQINLTSNLARARQ